MQTSPPWMVSLHGGHNSHACDHASDPLEAIVEAAVARGYRVFGVTEHAPRCEPERLFQEEHALGWDVATLERLFAEHVARLDHLREVWADRITLLKGMEIETVPVGCYAEVMLELKVRHGIQYLVGSAHFVDGYIIDYTREEYEKAAEALGGSERLAVRYYQTVAEMVEALKPEVIGHYDLPRKWATDEDSCATPAIRRAALETLETIRDHASILDVNTGGYRRGFGRPYPAPWIVREAHRMGIPFCFGDDSHAVGQVGAGIEEARQYLLSLGVEEISLFTPSASGLERQTAPLTG